MCVTVDNENTSTNYRSCNFHEPYHDLLNIIVIADLPKKVAFALQLRFTDEKEVTRNCFNKKHAKIGLTSFKNTLPLIYYYSKHWVFIKSFRRSVRTNLIYR